MKKHGSAAIFAEDMILDLIAPSVAVAGVILFGVLRSKADKGYPGIYAALTENGVQSDEPRR